MTEREQAIKIANLLLERPWTDPDCAETILARQFLRAIERENILPGTTGNRATVSSATGIIDPFAK